MQLFSKILILLVVFSSSVYAQDKQSSKAGTSSAETIDLVYGFGTDIGEEIVNMMGGEEAMYQLVGLVQKFGPVNEDTIFHWKKTTKRLPVKNINLIFTTSDDPALTKPQQKSTSKLEHNPGDADAQTILLLDKAGKNPEIFVYIFLDKIYFDEHFNKRDDENVRVITALSHEIYGNVNAYLTSDPKESLVQNEILRINKEIKAFRAGIQCLNRAIEELEGKEGVLEIVEKMKLAIEREIVSLDYFLAEKEKKTSVGFFNNRFTIKNNAEVEIMDVYSIAGKKQNISGLYDSKTKILDLNSLPIGTYIVQIKVKNPIEERIEKILILK